MEARLECAMLFREVRGSVAAWKRRKRRRGDSSVSVRLCARSRLPLSDRSGLYFSSVSLSSATKNTRCGQPGRQSGPPRGRERRQGGGDLPTAMCGPLARSIKQTSSRTRPREGGSGVAMMETPPGSGSGRRRGTAKSRRSDLPPICGAIWLRR